MFYHPEDYVAVRTAWIRAQDTIGARTHGAVKYHQLLEGVTA